jgi:hypothetical protein
MTQTLYHRVANIHLNSDGDDIILAWNTETQKLYLSSTLDDATDECNYNSVRKTIYWAMGERPRTCQIPIVIHDLVRYHTEKTMDGSIITEHCSEEQCADLLNGTWDGLVANRIHVIFTVSVNE